MFGCYFKAFCILLFVIFIAEFSSTHQSVGRQVTCWVVDFLMYEWSPNRLLCIQVLTETLCQVDADGIQLYVYVTADCFAHFSV